VQDFFFQAEDGIRDGHVTGVQTCALPILLLLCLLSDVGSGDAPTRLLPGSHLKMPALLRPAGERGLPGAYADQSSEIPLPDVARSEERRVGKERRSGRWAWPWAKGRGTPR